MSKFTEAMKAGSKAVIDANGGQFKAGGSKVVCSHCKNDVFTQEEAMLNKPTTTLFNLDWADRSGTALVCSNCGLIQWFAKEPEKMSTHG